MSTLHRNVLLPVLTSAGSFLFLIILVMSTSPIRQVTVAVLFFVLLLILLISLGYLVINLAGGRVTAKRRSRIVIASLLIITALMLSSAQSFNSLELLVLVLIGVGLWFYSGRR